MHGNVIRKKKRRRVPGSTERDPKRLNWNNLADYKCPNPECEHQLMYDEDTQLFHCLCPFKISEKRLGEITSQIANGAGSVIRKPSRMTPEERQQSKLNDL